MSVLRGLFIRKDATRGTTPVEARNALQAIFPSAGVVDGLTVSGKAGDWHYSVAAGHAVTTRGGTDGVTILTVDGATDTPVVAAAPASGSRWDLIWIRHNDVDSGDADSAAVLGVTEGTASGSPSKPYGSVPAGALVLAEAQVAAGATGTLHANVTITQVATSAHLRGAVVDASTVTTAADGSWTANFPAGKFTAAPIVTATVLTSTQIAAVRIESISASLATGRVHYWAGSWATTSGFAVEVTAVSA